MTNIHGRVILGLLTLGVVLVATDSICGQKKLISHREYFEGVYPKQTLPWHERSRRVETVRETLNNGIVIETETTIDEVLKPNRSRYYIKTVENGKVREHEEITIEHMRYTRTDGGKWSKIDLRTQAGGTGTGSGSSATSCTQYTVESVFVNGMAGKLFERTDIRSVEDELRFSESRDWIGEDGLPYREENVTGKLFPRVEAVRETTTYEYTLNLRIEAPIN